MRIPTVNGLLLIGGNEQLACLLAALAHVEDPVMPILVSPGVPNSENPSDESTDIILVQRVRVDEDHSAMVDPLLPPTLE